MYRLLSLYHSSKSSYSNHNHLLYIALHRLMLIQLILGKRIQWLRLNAMLLDFLCRGDEDTLARGIIELMLGNLISSVVENGLLSLEKCTSVGALN